MKALISMEGRECKDRDEKSMITLGEYIDGESVYLGNRWREGK